MGKCKYFQVCGLEDPGEPDDYLCILHCPDRDKSQTLFNLALGRHREDKKRGKTFDRFVFPCPVDFSGESFDEEASFVRARFLAEATFTETRFFKHVSFAHCVFDAQADFSGAVFDGLVWFTKTTVKADASFIEAEFLGRSYFQGATFEGGVWFSKCSFVNTSFKNTSFLGRFNFDSATFSRLAFFVELSYRQQASFRDTTFRGYTTFRNIAAQQGVDFSGAVFEGEVEFADVVFDELADFRQGRFLGSVIFSDATGNKVFLGEANFQRSVIKEGSLIFRGLDLGRCRLVGSDTRGARFIGVRWPRTSGRDCVYDEVAVLNPGEKRDWAQLEELYRQLKANYEERRDYERAGHFHMGEKEMRLQNPETRSDLKCVLALYKAVSGYGENYFRPLLWLLALLLVTVAGAFLGVTMMNAGEVRVLSVYQPSHWGWAFLYGVETIFHLPAKEFNSIGLARVVQPIAGIFGPVFLALFGLALRQRLRR